jgi:hypothetical protein
MRAVHTIGDAVPGLVLVLVLAMAAIPAERIVSSSRRGRARTAVAYLTGFGAGLATTFAVGVVASLRDDAYPIGGLGILGSFVGPFVGVGSAWFYRPTRRRHRATG